MGYENQASVGYGNQNPLYQSRTNTRPYNPQVSYPSYLRTESGHPYYLTQEDGLYYKNLLPADQALFPTKDRNFERLAQNENYENKPQGLSDSSSHPHQNENPALALSFAVDKILSLSKESHTKTEATKADASAPNEDAVEKYCFFTRDITFNELNQ